MENICGIHHIWCFHSSPMAKNTRLKELQNDLKKDFEAIVDQDKSHLHLGSRMDSIEKQLSGIQALFDQLSLNLLSLSTTPPVGATNSSSAATHLMVPPIQMRKVKLDFPKFDSTDPLDWLYKDEQFFAYYHTLDADRLIIAAVHFQGLVVQWF